MRKIETRVCVCIIPLVTAVYTSLFLPSVVVWRFFFFSLFYSREPQAEAARAEVAIELRERARR